LYVCEAGSHPTPKIIKAIPDDLNQTLTNNSILFLTGYQSPSWLKAIGGYFKIDPEFFNRHMTYIGSLEEHGASTSGSAYVLPSSSRTMFRTSITSLGKQQGPHDQTWTFKRRKARTDMKKYLEDLQQGLGWLPGHSVVQH
jgi:hypothetical protein